MAKRNTPSPACSACRVQRKKCSEECILAPHFPADDPHKFAIVQSVFGTSHIVRQLQSLTAEQRRDAVNSMVYEATARVDDPVHGCARTIHQMQKRIAELEAQLVATQEDLKNMRCEYDQLVLLSSNGSQDAQNVLYTTDITTSTSPPVEDNVYEVVDPLMLWSPLWDL